MKVKKVLTKKAVAKANWGDELKEIDPEFYKVMLQV